jgi:hypothetical protein
MNTEKRLKTVAILLSFLMGANAGIVAGFALHMYTHGVLWIVMSVLSTITCALLFLSVKWLDEAQRLRDRRQALPAPKARLTCPNSVVNLNNRQN